METSFLPLIPIVPVLSTAACRVWAIAELVENILLRIHAADVLRCRRVSKRLHEIVMYSKSLRRSLYLEPDPSSQRGVNPLAPTWFGQLRNGYRDSTIAAKIDILTLWMESGTEVRPLWDKMFIAQPPPTQCVIPVGNHLTIYFRRTYPDGMTFGDLERAVIAAFEIRRNKRYSSKERLEELSLQNSVLIYWR